jgi:Fe-S cluster biogenesis protein NfuA
MLQTTLKQQVKAALGLIGLYDPTAPISYRDGAVTPVTIPIPHIPPAAPPGLTPADLAASEADALAPRHHATPAGFEPGLMEDLTSLPLTMENVEDVLDEMVRPALNADGGDITLIEIKGNDVYVKLVGACSSCPSSIMTMKMGVERLLQDEFPQMGELIQVDSMF